MGYLYKSNRILPDLSGRPRLRRGERRRPLHAVRRRRLSLSNNTSNDNEHDSYNAHNNDTTADANNTNNNTTTLNQKPRGRSAVSFRTFKLEAS